MSNILKRITGIFAGLVVYGASAMLAGWLILEYFLPFHVTFALLLYYMPIMMFMVLVERRVFRPLTIKVEKRLTGQEASFLDKTLG